MMADFVENKGLHFSQNSTFYRRIALIRIAAKKKRATPWAARFADQGVDLTQLDTSSFFTAR